MSGGRDRGALRARADTRRADKRKRHDRVCALPSTSAFWCGQRIQLPGRGKGRQPRPVRSNVGGRTGCAQHNRRFLTEVSLLLVRRTRNRRSQTYWRSPGHVPDAGARRVHNSQDPGSAVCVFRSKITASIRAGSPDAADLGQVPPNSFRMGPRQLQASWCGVCLRKAHACLICDNQPA